MANISRRDYLSLLGFAACGGLSSCVEKSDVGFSVGHGQEPVRSAEPDTIYGSVQDRGFMIPAFPYRNVAAKYYRQTVADPTGEAPGTIVVDTSERLLYLVKADRQAARYGVGIGAAGFAWKGQGVIATRQEWPRWTPPTDMLARKPGLTRYTSDHGSMAPGLSNPLGARALYISKDGKDTLYRIHGTPEWQSIGTASSSGCVRLFNQDIIDLYKQVAPGAKIAVA